MSAIAAALKHMLAAGMPHDAIVAAVAEMEAEVSAPRDPVAERKRERDRVRMQLKRSDGRATSRDSSDNGDTPPKVRPLSPQTPLTPTPTPPENTTRAEREREDAGFARFWLAYPRKTAKADARKAFAKAWRKLPPFDEEAILIGGLERAKAGWGEAQFIPHAATWLNGERWTDEPAEVIPLQPRRAPHERPHHDAKFEARQANLARAERGFELAARFHREP